MRRPRKPCGPPTGQSTPETWEGGRVIGRAAVRQYWTRQLIVRMDVLEPPAPE
jgi:hypothetical protein